VQGVTEWLPISSSGHLVILQELLGLKLPFIFHLFLHVGTLGVICANFRRQILGVIKALARGNFETDEGKLALFIIVGSVPTAIIGFLFRCVLESVFYNSFTVGLALLITGLLLYLSEKRKDGRELSFLDSFLMGIAQGVAIIPGISRSGVTITTGLMRKVKKESVITYSFLLSVPAIVGATVFELGDVTLAEFDAGLLFFGMATSMIVGYVSLRFLLNMIVKERFHLFAYYCWAAGLLLVLSKAFMLF
jgi:undecaprenyl-diphosphatase